EMLPARSLTRVENCVARGIIDRQSQMKTLATPRLQLGIVDDIAQRLGQPVSAPYHRHSNPIRDTSRSFTREITRQQQHERLHFLLRTLPVVRRESIDSQDTDAT